MGLNQQESIETTEMPHRGCRCKKKAAMKLSQQEKENRLKIITQKMNKTTSSIHNDVKAIF